jgi:ABC-type transport system involved in multi-copper enzyme maturation permease subunit
MILFAVLFSMRIFSGDKDDGSLVMFLTRPVARWEYAVGRVAGIWALASLFMATLHAAIFFIAWYKTGGIIPGYLTASMICTVNLLFAVTGVCLLTLFVPDVFAAVAIVAIAVTGYVSDGLYLAMQSEMVRSALSNAVDSPAMWRVVFPKLGMVQHGAVALIGANGPAVWFGPVHPVVNVLGYAAVMGIVLVLYINRKEM